MGIKVGMVSLGCDKNTVDTERILGKLTSASFEIVQNPEEADYIIINTCAFIESAKVESIDAIMEMSQYKSRNCKKIIVIGCLANRYYNELKENLNEADIIVKINDYDNIINIINQTEVREAEESTPSRIITTPYHYSYLKISEGCNNKCTYCAIPSIRGPYKSETINGIIDEAKRLIDDYSVKELILVAQDVTRYGIDIYNKYALLDLIDELEKLDIQWIRLMYCYPELVTDELIRRVASGGKVAKYLDIPMQHISDDILKRMNRKNNQKDTYNLLDRIRKIDDNISIRSTFIVGFPNESEENYQELAQFIRYAELDNCGFFSYSREEGTPAYKMSGQINKRVKEDRTDRLYGIQTETLLNKYKRMIGTNLKVMYEGIDYDNQCFYGRSERSAPNIDSKMLFTGATTPIPGQMVNVNITGNKELNLTATIIEQ